MKYTNHDRKLPILQFDNLLKSERIQHAVFTRQGGVSPNPFSSLNLSVSVADDKTDVYANRRRAYGIFGRDAGSVVHAHLVHEAKVGRVTQDDNGTWIAHTDGLLTDQPGCALTMNYADCTPIFLFDPSKANLLAGIGPAIGPCCYEVDEPVISQVRETFANAGSLLLDGQNGAPKANGDHLYFDLPEANRRNLQRAGVQQIEMAGLCTACRTDLFFSHRAEKGKTGRFGTILILN